MEAGMWHPELLETSGWGPRGKGGRWGGGKGIRGRPSGSQRVNISNVVITSYGDSALENTFRMLPCLRSIYLDKLFACQGRPVRLFRNMQENIETLSFCNLPKSIAYRKTLYTRIRDTQTLTNTSITISYLMLSDTPFSIDEFHGYYIRHFWLSTFRHFRFLHISRLVGETTQRNILRPD